jgi:hypothetical protein
MSKPNLFALAGLAAILGGIGRAASSFAPHFLTGEGAQYLFLATDILLTLAVIGFYGVIASRAGIIALAGFIACIASMLILQDHDEYMGAALIFAIGLVAMGVAAVVTRSFAWPGPLFWILSLAVGLFGVGVPGYASAFVLSGLLFSIGFILAGVEMRKGGGHH